MMTPYLAYIQVVIPEHESHVFLVSVLKGKLESISKRPLFFRINSDSEEDGRN